MKRGRIYDLFFLFLILIQGSLAYTVYSFILNNFIRLIGPVHMVL